MAGFSFRNTITGSIGQADDPFACRQHLGPVEDIHTANIRCGDKRGDYNPRLAGHGSRRCLAADAAPGALGSPATAQRVAICTPTVNVTSPRQTNVSQQSPVARTPTERVYFGFVFGSHFRFSPSAATGRGFLAAPGRTQGQSPAADRTASVMPGPATEGLPKHRHRLSALRSRLALRRAAGQHDNARPPATGICFVMSGIIADCRAAGKYPLPAA